MSTEGPKSAVELVMERLRRQDGAAGGEVATLNDEQKGAIAAARRDYDAKVAQAEILFRSALAGAPDHDARQELEANHRRDLRQFASSRDRRIDAARKGASS